MGLLGPVPRPPLLPPAGCRAGRPVLSAPWQPGLTPGVRLPLGDIKGPTGGRARRPRTLGFPIADQVLEECGAREQAGRHKLQQQGEQEDSGQREPQSSQRGQRRELGPLPGTHGPRARLPHSRSPLSEPAQEQQPRGARPACPGATSVTRRGTVRGRGVLATPPARPRPAAGDPGSVP